MFVGVRRHHCIKIDCRGINSPLEENRDSIRMLAGVRRYAGLIIL